MKGKTINQTQHADWLTSDTRVSAASIPPLFPFDRTVVSINCVSLTIISMSSAIVDDGETSISISLPDAIIDATPAIIFGSQIIVSEMPIIIFTTETLISGDHQTPANQGVTDGSNEITISVPETIIGRAETIRSILQIRISKRKAIISERIVVIDGLYMIIAGPDSIISVPDSIIYIQEAMMSIAETKISTTQTDFPKGDTVISAFPMSFLAAEVIISASRKPPARMRQFDWNSFSFSSPDTIHSSAGYRAWRPKISRPRLCRSCGRPTS